MNNNKRKRMYRMGLLSDKAVKPVEVQKPAVVEPEVLPVALKELPEQPVVDVQVSEEAQASTVEKKKVTKVKKVVEEDKPADV